MSYRKGAQAERKMIEILRELGFACVRVAGSGRARFEQPDILASNRKRLLSIECKHVNSDSVYIPKEEICALLRFSKNFGAEPMLTVRFRKTWEFWHLSNIEDIENKNFCFKKGLGEKTI